ncbi:MAG: cell division protein FtsA, partial [Patescibacteria group bacterium]
GQRVMLNDAVGHIAIIGAAEVPSQGISKGGITSLDDAVSSITTCLEQAERLIGLPISDVTVGIGGTCMTSQMVKGVIGISRPEGDIRPEDVARALEAAQMGVNPANVEILHVLPRNFVVDGQTGITDPVGMRGIRLEVNAQIVHGLSGHVRNLATAVTRTGLDIVELVSAPLALAEAITTARERELGVAVLSLGAGTTGLAVYEDGELLHAATLPIGADHITNDIAIGLRTSLDIAERVKCACGRADAENLPTRGADVDLADFGADQSELVPIRFIAEIIQARVEELYDKVEAEFRRIERSGLLPVGVILSGGGSKLSGLVEVGKQILRLPCARGRVAVQSHMPEYVEDPVCSTVIGLALWSSRSEGRVTRTGDHKTFMHGMALLGKLKRPFGKLWRSFVP